MDSEEILRQLTTEEKISLLCGYDNWHTYPIDRFDLPKVRFTDGPNGVRGTKAFNGSSAACFPCGTAMGSTFNKTLLIEAGQLMAIESKHKGAHVILGPTCNMQRGPLGGRGFESFSEDPYLSGLSSSSIIRGMQQENIAATIKHFVCNDLEHERKASDSILTERNLREIYLEPFRLAVKYSNPKCFMTSYTKVNGDRASQSKKLLKDILRDEWGWDGVVMSDWHGLYTAKTALENGLDLEMPGPTYYRQVKSIKHMVDSRELNVQDLDDRARNIINLIEYSKSAGIPEDKLEDELNNTEKTSETLRRIASESIVLLKNEDNILPLKREEKIAIIGPNAKICTFSGGGSAFLRPYYVTSPYESIVSKLSYVPDYSVGCYGFKTLPSLATQLINPVTGKKGYNMKFFLHPAEYGPVETREQFDELNLDQFYIFLQDYRHPKIKNDLYFIDIEGIFVPDETGEYIFGCTVLGTALLYVDNKLLVDNKTHQKKGTSFFNSGSVEVSNTIYLEKDAKYKIRLEFGSRPTFSAPDATVVDFGGGGGINFGAIKKIDPDEEIEKAVKIAKNNDKVVLSIGLTHEWETEGSDRPNMELPLLTNKLVSSVLKANSNTVIVNQSGTPVEFPWLEDSKCLVQAWYGGNEAGNAIADVLFGDYNPSGRLPLTFPKKLKDNPTYLNFKTERGRVLYGEDIFMGYRYYEKMEKEVAFPFGHGLSYTSFEHNNLEISIDENKDLLKVNVDIKNVGNLDGSEVIQLYISHDSSTIRPVKELKGYQKIHLLVGKSKNIEFTLSLKDSTSFFDECFDKWHMEEGDYKVLIGKSSENIQLVDIFTIKRSKLWLGL
ncbi:putative probable beta-glucosidase I [[Candida] jaroonii]|uniref:Probable beta-glucosidase I n=1 Tax=[Candida] jaroonii TaxID=467808 RepID=A0ACA9YCU6_9ASCO|nr:putative probable beta-glucosidase I [[Candida] jaroonii]